MDTTSTHINDSEWLLLSDLADELEFEGRHDESVALFKLLNGSANA